MLNLNSGKLRKTGKDDIILEEKELMKVDKILLHYKKLIKTS